MEEDPIQHGQDKLDSEKEEIMREQTIREKREKHLRRDSPDKPNLYTMKTKGNKEDQIEEEDGEI